MPLDDHRHNAAGGKHGTVVLQLLLRRPQKIRRIIHFLRVRHRPLDQHTRHFAVSQSIQQPPLFLPVAAHALHIRYGFFLTALLAVPQYSHKILKRMVQQGIQRPVLPVEVAVEGLPRDAFYTVANVPYGSMMSLITTDAADRAELSTFRSAGAMVAGILTGSLIPMMIYDSNSVLRGEVIFWIALFMGCLGFVFFQFMIRNTEIRVDTSGMTVSEEAPKFNILKAITNFVKNRAALGCTLAAFFQMACMYAGQTATSIVWQAYFKNAQISGLISMLSYFGIFLWMPFVRKVVGKFGKKELSVFALVWNLACYIVMCVLPITPDAKGMWTWTAVNVANSLGAGISSCLTWTLISDAIDYNEWKFGVRDEGTTYALYSFFRKLAQGIGPSLGLVVAVAMGYEATLGPNQPLEVASTMRYLVPAINIVSSLGGLVFMGIVFPLDKKTLAKMHADLAERKK